MCSHQKIAKYLHTHSLNNAPVYIKLHLMRRHHEPHQLLGAQACNQSLIRSIFPFSASAAATHHSRSQSLSAANISAILRLFWFVSSTQKYMCPSGVPTIANRGFTKGNTADAEEPFASALVFFRPVLHHSFAQCDLPQPVIICPRYFLSTLRLRALPSGSCMLTYKGPKQREQSPMSFPGP